MSGIRVGGLTVVRDQRVVLDRTDLAAGAGEWVGVIGPNGAGKTSLLEVLAGLLPAHGDVEVAGVDPRHVPRRDLARRVALVPQRPSAPAGMSVNDYVLLGRTPYLAYLGTPTAADRAIAADAIARLDLRRVSSRPVDHLSGGEFQRVVLARSLAQHAPVLLLDEPTSALDVGHQQDVLELVDHLRRTEGLTVVSAIHDLTVAGRYCDRLLLLAGGQQLALGTPTQVLTEAALAAAFGAQVRIVADPDGPVVVPSRLTRRDAAVRE